MKKKSTEIQEIFGLCRNDIRRLEDDGVLSPEKNGQGKISWFGMEDMNRLLDIKMYLLAGFRISDIKGIVNSDYDSNAGIDEQIHTYKKRIQMLEFIKTMRADIAELDSLNTRQLVNVSKISAEKTNMPRFGSDDFYNIFWDCMKMVFIIDSLSHSESDIVDKRFMLKRAFTAYQIIENIAVKRLGYEFSQKDVAKFFAEMRTVQVESEEEIRDFARELVEEISTNRVQIMEELDKENIEPIVEKLDEHSGAVIRNMMNHIFNFTIEYFLDETELFYLYSNFIRFINGLDIDALAIGVVKLGEK